MATKREIGYRLYHRQAKQSNTVSSASYVGGTTEQTSNVRYGTAQADSADGKVQVKLDNSDFVVNCYCDSPIKQGDRVKVIIDSAGNMTAMTIGNNIIDYTDGVKDTLEQQITDKGNEILDSVQDDIDEVNQAVQNAANKADQAASKADDLSDSLVITNKNVSDLSTSLEGVASSASAAMTAASNAQQDLNGFKTTVSQTYQTKSDASAAMAQEVLDRNSAIEQSATEIKSTVSETYQTKKDASDAMAQEVLDRNAAITQSATQIQQTVSQTYQTKTDAGNMQQNLQAQITVNANNISSEVENRTEAVNGALEDAKTYTNQTVEGISTTVEKNVMDTVGNTYATKTEVENLSDSITTTIEQSVSAGYATCSTSASTATKVASTAASSNIKLVKGITVSVKFTYANTASSPRLNVDGTGALYIRVGNSNMTVDQSWDAGSTVMFIYDGTYWQLSDSMTYGTTLSTKTIIRQDTNGITVGKSTDTIKARVSSSGQFQVLNGTKPFVSFYGENGNTAVISTPSWGSFKFQALDNILTMSNAGLNLSCMYPGFTIGGSPSFAPLETHIVKLSGSQMYNSFSGKSVPYLFNANSVEFGVIYYYDVFGYGHRSVRFVMDGATTVTVYLCGYGLSSNALIDIREGIEITLTNSSNPTFSINRKVAGPIRANIGTSVGVNTNPGNQFYIEAVTFCCGN